MYSFDLFFDRRITRNYLATMCCGRNRNKNPDDKKSNSDSAVSRDSSQPRLEKTPSSSGRKLLNATASSKRRFATLTTMSEDRKGTPKEDVDRAMLKFLDETLKKGVDGLLKEYEKIKPSSKLSAEACKKNPDKNRYNNIPCYDDTRIVLKYQVPPETDYIHANRVNSKMAILPTDFICTQGPTEKTINDFWRMVWQERPSFIVMLCKVVENGKPKCAQYWPENVGDSKQYGTVKVTNTKVDQADRVGF